MSVVFDANCWVRYVDEWVDESHGDAVAAFDQAKETTGIAIDAGGRIKQQYVDARRPWGAELFDVWFEGVAEAGKLIVTDLAGTPNLFAELTSLGVPKAEHLYFRVAVRSKSRSVVSEDVDFFHPQHKGCGEQKRLQILKKATGPVCRHMKKNHKVSVCCLHGYLVHEGLREN